jgi:hypothetical protein
MACAGNCVYQRAPPFFAFDAALFDYEIPTNVQGVAFFVTVVRSNARVARSTDACPRQSLVMLRWSRRVARFLLHDRALKGCIERKPFPQSQLPY